MGAATCSRRRRLRWRLLAQTPGPWPGAACTSRWTLDRGRWCNWVPTSSPSNNEHGCYRGKRHFLHLFAYFNRPVQSDATVICDLLPATRNLAGRRITSSSLVASSRRGHGDSVARAPPQSFLFQQVSGVSQLDCVFTSSVNALMHACWVRSLVCNPDGWRIAAARRRSAGCPLCLAALLLQTFGEHWSISARTSRKARQAELG